MGSPAAELAEVLDLLAARGLVAEYVTVGEMTVRFCFAAPVPPVRQPAEELTPEQQRARMEDLLFRSARAP